METIKVKVELDGELVKNLIVHHLKGMFIGKDITIINIRKNNGSQREPCNHYDIDLVLEDKE